MWVATLAAKYWKHFLGFVIVAFLVLGLWSFGDRLYDRYFGVTGAVKDVTERPSAGPIVEGPGPPDVAFRDSSGGVDLVETEDLSFDPELGIEVEREGGEDVRLAVGVQQVWLPDITGQSAAKVKSLSGSTDVVRATPQRAPLLGLSSQVSVGVSATQVAGGLTPGVMVNYSPLQVWAFRFGVFGTLSGSSGEIPVRLGAGPSVSTRLTRTIRPLIGYDAVQNGPTIGLTVDI